MTKSISNYKIDKSIENNLDNQINEIKKRFELLKMKARGKSTPRKKSNQYNENVTGSRNPSFKFDEEMTPLRSVDTNKELKEI